jgi:integrase
MDGAHLQQVGDSNLYAEAGGSDPAPMSVPKPRGFAQAGISRTRASCSRTPQDITLPEGHTGEDPQPPPWGAMRTHATQLNPLHA